MHAHKAKPEPTFLADPRRQDLIECEHCNEPVYRTRSGVWMHLYGEPSLGFNADTIEPTETRDQYQANRPTSPGAAMLRAGGN